MKDMKDGGPAFPRIDGIEPHDYGRQDVVSTPGMSLRDWFAGHAPPMPEWWHDLWLTHEKWKARNDDRYQMRSTVGAMAAWALEYADAMLAERDR